MGLIEDYETEEEEEETKEVTITETSNSIDDEVNKDSGFESVNTDSDSD